MTSAFAAAAGIFWARSTDVSSLLRPSFRVAGPSGEENASSTWSGFTTARSAVSFHPSFAEFAAIKRQHRAEFGRNTGVEFTPERGPAAGGLAGADRAHRMLFGHRQGPR